MGYLIGGAGEGPEQKIIESSDNPYEKLTDSELRQLRDQTEKDVAKFNNFQTVSYTHLTLPTNREV